MPPSSGVVKTEKHDVQHKRVNKKNNNQTVF